MTTAMVANWQATNLFRTAGKAIRRCACARHGLHANFRLSEESQLSVECNEIVSVSHP